ncbi:transposase family protein [Candidatus Magnetoovum chiemensis]|nr:transposase family protein [Candidatus Magnetoovum chiemensis]
MITLNILAFSAHTFLEFVDLTYRAVRQKLAARKRFFHDFNTLTKYLLFDSWQHLINFMSTQLKIPSY